LSNDARLLADYLRDDAFFHEEFDEIMTLVGAHGPPMFKALGRALRNKPIELLKRSEIATLIFWDDMQWRFQDEKDAGWAAPLKHWRDEAAWEFVRAVSKDRMKPGVYSGRRCALGLKPPRESGLECKVNDFTPAIGSRIRELMTA
jgi:hypothetical protein